LEYFDPRDYDLAGRIAKLRTLHGVIETPYLFPVVNPLKQQPPINTLEKIGFNAFITNAYLFYRRNKGIVKNIHEELKWNKPIMTDSGGYQILVYGEVEIDNKTIVSYEKSIGVDIGVILDIPTGTKMSWSEARKAVFETFHRAVEALPLIMDSKQLWVLPIQGSPYKDLLTYSSIKAWKLPYHIHALGSPTVLLEKYDYERIVELVAIAKMHLPPHKPLHVFGVGHPMIIPFLVALGADLFDSASYILYARDNRYMTETGTKRLEELQYLPCNCPVCSKYTVKEILEMRGKERIELLATHNLYMLRKELENTKQAIKEGRLWEYLEYKSKAHPSLRRAFQKLIKYLNYLKKYNPLSKGGSFALLLIDKDSLNNPRLQSIKEYVSKYIIMKKYSGKKIVFIPAYKKPFDQEEAVLEIKNRLPNHKILLFHHYLGVFPPELSNTYPYFQHEIGVVDGELINMLVNDIKNFIRRIKPREVLFVKTGIKEFDSVIERIIGDEEFRTTYTLGVLSSSSQPRPQEPS
jgi:7-cyano-7-deazaguanine tRNA-ribosyltransferase